MALKIYKSKKIDFLSDTPMKIFLSSVLPLMAVAVLSVFTQSLINDIYTIDIGDTIFTVTGIVATITSLLTSLVSNVVSASWIKSSPYVVSDKKRFRIYFIQSLYSLLAVYLSVTLIFVFFTNDILTLLNVPQEVFYETKQYIQYYVFSNIVLSLASYMLIIANGTGSSARILISNTISSCGPLLTSFILIHCFKLGIIGAAIVNATNALLLMTFCLFVLTRDKLITKPAKRELLPKVKIIGSILSYGSILFIQCAFSAIGYMLVTAQANKFLSLDYLSVLGLRLPILVGMSSIAMGCQLFVAPNFAIGNSDRLKRFLFISTIVCMIYGIICFAFYAIFGKMYYAAHFQSETIVKLGAEYWFYYGLGHLFIPLLFTIRFFLEAVGYGKVSLLAGVCEFLGNFFCAYVLIPHFGNIGCSLSYTIGWALASIYLFISYMICRKRIYEKCDKNKPILTT